jgi:hypothetical protein
MLSFVKFAELWKNWQAAKAFFAHGIAPAGVMQRIDFTSATGWSPPRPFASG